MSKNTPQPQQASFDLPELLDANFSVKSDAFAQAVLGDKVKPTYKRAFEGLMSKLTPVDIDGLIQNDSPLRVRLKVDEYRAMFPRDTSISDIFLGTAEYYTEFSHIRVYPDGDTTKKPKMINVVDTAEILDDGSIQFLFTRGIMPHLNDMKSHLLVMSIKDFSRLSAKYSQHLFNMFSNWLGKDVVSTRVSIESLRILLSVPVSYNNSRFLKNIIKISVTEINEKTSVHVDYEPIKGDKGKAYQWIDFTVCKKSDMEDVSPDQLELAEEVAINQFNSVGVTDEQFSDIIKMRKDKNKPVYQQSMNAYFEQMIEISQMPDTLDFPEILRKSIASGWVIYLEKKWFIDETRSVTDNPVPGQQPVKAEEDKSQLPKADWEDSLEGMAPQDALRNAMDSILRKGG